MYKNLSILYILIIFISCSEQNKNAIKVHNQNELNEAINTVNPGDEIVLSNGIWKNVAIEFKAEGTKTKPIVLRAETVGEVFIEGESYVRLGGDYLEVNGLYFRNGFTPKNTIIDFRIDNDTFANNSKVTNCVIEDFSQPNREVTDHWVEFWGRNNELSNCYIAGKSNFGPTVRVFLKGNEHIKNYHQIVNNHFGPRPRKGGPHGETLQIGDSNTSMTPSHTNVSNNYFERCNGEVEIISSKSNNNEFKHNIFFECEGSLVLRHGNYATIDGNIFIGNDNSKFIGGIRVVNTGHWITNNYFYKIKGSEFRSALAVMNGIPKSPLNRYNQVTDAVIAYNSYIDCISPLNFSVGANIDKKDVLPASEIRSERPVRTIVANNLIFNHQADEYPIVNYDKVDGVLFKNNILNSTNKSEVQSDGLITENFEVEQLSDWLFVPTQNNSDVYNGFDFETITTDLFGSLRAKNNAIGAITLPINEGKINFDKSTFGPAWFNAEKSNPSPSIIEVSNDTEFNDAVKNATSETVISLKSGTYNLTKSLAIHNNMTITSADKNNRAVINYTGAQNTPAFELNPKGNLVLDALILKGSNTQNAFSTLEKDMTFAFNLWLKNSEISDFNSVLKVSKGSFADTISVANSVVKNCLNGFELAEEIDAKGDYNAEFVFITNSTFENVQQNVLNYFRGGYDESTIGGNLTFNNNTVTNCGLKENTGVLLQTTGIVNVELANNKFINNPVTYIAVLWGEKGQQPINNQFSNSGKIIIEQNLKQKLMY